VSASPEESAPAAAGLTSDVLDSSQAGGRVIRGGVLRVLSYGLMIALSVLSTALLTRHLGVARFGYYTTVLSLVAVVAYITDSGMSAVGVREFAVRSGADRDALMSDLFGLRVVLSGAGALLVAGFGLAAGYGPGLLAGAVLASLATVALVVQHTYTIPISAQLRIGTLSALDLARQVLIVAMIVVLVTLGAGLLPLLAVVLLVNLILLGPTAALARHQASLRLRLRPRRWLDLTQLIVAFSLASAVGTMYIYTAQIITSLVASEQQSGLFAASFRIFIVICGVPNLLISGALPLLARAARDDGERLSYALHRIFEVSLILGVAATLATLGGARFMIAVVAGPKYEASVQVLQIQGLALVASFVLAGWSYALLSLKHYTGVLVANVLAFAVSCSLTIVLASSHGASGAAVASVCGESVLALGLLIALVSARPELRPAPAILLKVAFAAAPAIAVVLSSLASPVRALLALAVYGALLALTRAVPDELFELLPARARRAALVASTE
jgi:O-antigen/teichoic acid export membrane protein